MVSMGQAAFFNGKKPCETTHFGCPNHHVWMLHSPNSSDLPIEIAPETHRRTWTAPGFKNPMDSDHRNGGFRATPHCRDTPYPYLYIYIIDVIYILWIYLFINQIHPCTTISHICVCVTYIYIYIWIPHHVHWNSAFSFDLPLQKASIHLLRRPGNLATLYTLNGPRRTWMLKSWPIQLSGYPLVI